MPESATGQYIGRSIYMVGPLALPLGTCVKMLLVADPDYGDPESDGSEPPPTLTDAEIEFWSAVLSRSREHASKPS